MLFYPQRNPDDAEKAIFLTAVEVEQDETTNAFLRGTAVCRQNRPGEQRFLAAALDAPVNCTPFVRQYGILFRKWGVFVCQRDNESTTERRR